MQLFRFVKIVTFYWHRENEDDLKYGYFSIFATKKFRTSTVYLCIYSTYIQYKDLVLENNFFLIKLFKSYAFWIWFKIKLSSKMGLSSKWDCSEN